MTYFLAGTASHCFVVCTPQVTAWPLFCHISVVSYHQLINAFKCVNLFCEVSPYNVQLHYCGECDLKMCFVTLQCRVTMLCGLSCHGVHCYIGVCHCVVYTIKLCSVLSVTLQCVLSYSCIICHCMVWLHCCVGFHSVMYAFTLVSIVSLWCALLHCFAEYHPTLFDITLLCGVSHYSVQCVIAMYSVTL